MTLLTSWVHRYTLRDLLDDSFDLFKERGITLLMAGALPYVLVVAYQALMRFYVLPGHFLRDYSDIKSMLGLLANTAFWLYVLGLALVGTVAFAVSLLAQCRVASAHVRGETVSWHEVYRGAFVPSLRMIGLAIVYSFMLAVAAVITYVIAFFILMLVVVLLGVFGFSGEQLGTNLVFIVTVVLLLYASMLLATVFVSALFLAAPVLVARGGCGVFAAISRSFRYASANYKANLFALSVLFHLPILFTLLATGLQMLLMYGLQYLAPAAGETVGETITFLVSALSFSAIIACQSALTLLDGQCRVEGLDLQLMAQEMGLEAEAVAQVLQKPAAPTRKDAPRDLSRHVAGAVATPDPPAAAPLYPDYFAPPPALAVTTTAPLPVPAESGEEAADAE